MIVFSHLAIGRLIYSQLLQNGYKLDYRRFVYGNVKPDISKMIRYQPHNINASLGFILDEMSSLTQYDYTDNSKDFSFRLGIICHYLTDFFTFAHNSSFEGSFRDHMLYEMSIHECAGAFSSAVRSAGVSISSSIEQDMFDLYRKLMRLHGMYMRFEEADPQRDFSYAIMVCLTACISLINMREYGSRFSPAVAL